MAILLGIAGLAVWFHIDTGRDEWSWQEKLSAENKLDDEVNEVTTPTPSSKPYWAGVKKSDQPHFTFSPNRKHIAFIQDTFREYGGDYDRNSAVHVFDIETQAERRLLVDDTKLSFYEWRDNVTLRVFHNAGTGTRGYRDFDITSSETIFSQEHKSSSSPAFWAVDEEYTNAAQDAIKARQRYYELNPSL